MRFIYLVVAGVFLGMMGCRGCIEQHDPRGDWKRFETESKNANRPEQVLTDDGKIPSPVVAEVTEGNPVDEKYANYCSTCHGPQGKGDGPASAGLNPKPRNFTTWNDPTVTDEHIAKVIREGGASVGKSAAMAPWGGVLSADDIKLMVGKVRSFSKK